MEVKEAAGRRAVIAKPVACRPTRNSTFGSFSELLAGAVNASSPPPPSPIAAIIKPKTLRFNPPAPQPHPESCRAIVYRPRAKLVSKRTASLLANMAPNDDPILLPRFNSSHQEAGEELISPCSNNAVEAQPQQATEQLKISTLPIESQRLEAEDIPKAAVLSAAAASSVQVAYGDRPSYDGYNWRKYGQKQVKGSEYPRSYYKCTHPSCPVKKKVERSLDGQIAEIVYKGEHNHSKPSLPARRSSIGCEAVGGEIRMESGLLLLPSSSAAGTGSDGCRGGRPAADVEVQGDDDEPRTKRRRAEDRAIDHSGNAGEAGGRETAGAAADGEVLGDGFRWRKYGQKVVRGNLYPRSYYRCTNLKCKVRKYVERSPDDPNALVTTYEGKHNHDIPAP
ncbi:unnamed protein product [Linum tenue]|uniref:WRKY domain-containing protein n=1 Tax=Linum tenue TaxID=586396 RepID=A0AAV0PMW0_9ROSI|nr:unnamed protein product [Linum tenue]